jgi:hypothetical protein
MSLIFRNAQRLAGTQVPHLTVSSAPPESATGPRQLPHREVGPVVGGDQQHPVGQRQRPLPAGDPVGHARTTAAGDLGDQPAEDPPATGRCTGG